MDPMPDYISVPDATSEVRMDLALPASDASSACSQNSVDGLSMLDRLYAASTPPRPPCREPYFGHYMHNSVASRQYFLNRSPLWFPGFYPTPCPTVYSSMRWDNQDQVSRPQLVPYGYVIAAASPAIHASPRLSPSLEFTSRKRNQSSIHPYSYTRPVSSTLNRDTLDLMKSILLNSISATPTQLLDPKTMLAGLSTEQLPAVQAILEFLTKQPEKKIPASLVTQELAEVSEGKGYCLIGNCGSIRAGQKADPNYDPSTDKEYRKRFDHLCDHLKNKHFTYSSFATLSNDPRYQDQVSQRQHESYGYEMEAKAAQLLAYFADNQGRQNRDRLEIMNNRTHGDPNVPCPCCHDTESPMDEHSDYDDESDCESVGLEEDGMEIESSNASDNSGSEFGGN